MCHSIFPALPTSALSQAMAALKDALSQAMGEMNASWFVVEPATHDAIIVAAFKQRGFDDDEARAAARCCRQATFLGNRTHNALKALDVEVATEELVAETARKLMWLGWTKRRILRYTRLRVFRQVHHLSNRRRTALRDEGGQPR
mgnify:CR=1 FL=1